MHIITHWKGCLLYTSGTRSVPASGRPEPWEPSYTFASCSAACLFLFRHLSARVYDDGAGFSEEALLSATSPFYKENTENDHFGLGLSICNTLCQKQGGQLSLFNQNGACVEMQIQAEKFEAD